MAYVIVPLFALLSLIILIIINAKRGVTAENTPKSLRDLAYSLRAPEKNGKGLSVSYYKKTVNRAYRKLCSKKQSSELFGFEKWLYENHYIVKNCIKRAQYKGFGDLPHKGGFPRITILTDYLINTASEIDCRFTYEKIAEFNRITPLNMAEVYAISKALCFSALKELARLSEKSIHFNKMEAEAAKGFNLNYASSDSYLANYLLINGSVPKEYRNKCEDLRPETAKSHFTANLIECEARIKNIFDLLREIISFFSTERLLSLCYLNELFGRDKCYSEMSVTAQYAYADAAARLARKLNVAENVVANSAFALADRHKLPLGDVLFRPEALAVFIKKGKIIRVKDDRYILRQRLYIVIVITVSVILAVLPLLSGINAVTLTAIAPLFLFSLEFAELLVKRGLKSVFRGRPLLALDAKTVPSEGKTAVVVCGFISDEKSAENAFCRIRGLTENYVDPNVSYCLLVDFPQSKEEWSDKDENLKTYIMRVQEKESEFGHKIDVFIRKRQSNGDVYVGWERKRGAVMQLFKAFLSDDYSEFALYSRLENVKLAVLLDDDSELMPGTVKAAINTMLHPCNRKYDLMSFGCRINGYSLKTPYSQRFLTDVCPDCYPGGGEFYSDVFDCGVFCGKAIVRIEEFFRKLDGFFPTNRILSHDVIEGAVLRSVALKYCVYEDAPLSFGSDDARTKRWQRGDLQLLPYLSGVIKNSKGEKKVNPIQPVYKLIMLINAIKPVRDAFLLCVLFMSVLSGQWLLTVYGIILLILPYRYAFGAVFGDLRARVRPLFIITKLAESLLKTCERILLLPYYAVSGTALAVSTLINSLIGKKNMLYWKPFALTNTDGNISAHVRKLLPSFVVMLIVATAAQNSLFYAYIILFMGYSFLAFSNKSAKKKEISPSDGETLFDYARATYLFFAAATDESGLIRDNIQFAPIAKQYYLTSPTNIGFSILAEISAAELNIITEETAKNRIDKILNALEQCDKYEGNLYNWYDVKTLKPSLPLSVSSVDNANLIACLTVLMSYAEQREDKATFNRVKALIDNCSFERLYDCERKLYRIVYFPTENRYDGYYDLLASEARLLYYLHSARHGENEPYFNLGRDCTNLYNNTLLSWSGTAFEYLLPRIFLKPPENSLLYTSENNASRAQADRKICGVWGVSECGLYAFDDDMRYNYKANGLPELSLSSEPLMPVVAPYATALTLPYQPRKAIENLKTLTSLGVYGGYGFYESIDLKENKVIESCMAHHQGMLLASICNCLQNDVLSEYFSKAAYVESARLLLTEPRPKNGVSSEKKLCASAKQDNNKGISISVFGYPSQATVLSGREYAVVLDALGRGYSYCGYNVNPFYEDSFNRDGMFFRIRNKDGGTVFSPTVFPDCKEEDHTAYFDIKQVEYSNRKYNVIEQIRVLPYAKGELRRLKITNDTEEPITYLVAGYTDIALNDMSSIISHKAYSDMFVKTEIKNGYVLASRRFSDGKEGNYTVFCVNGLNELIYKTNRYNVIGRGGSKDSSELFERIERTDAPKEGQTLYPCLSFSGELTVAPKSSSEIYYSIRIAAHREDAEACADRAANDYENRVFGMLSGVGGESPDTGTLSAVNGIVPLSSAVTDLLYRPYCAGELAYYWDNGIPLSEQKTVSVDYASPSDEKSADLLVAIKGIIAVAGINAAYRITVTKEYREYVVAKYGDKGIAIIDKTDKTPPAFLTLNEKAVNCLLPLPKKANYAEKRRQDAPSTGEGCFIPDGGYRVVPYGETTLLPYSNVISNGKGGTVITENGGGFSFGENAREDRYTFWGNDAIEDVPSENVYLVIAGDAYRINTVKSGTCTHYEEKTVFSGEVLGIEYTLTLSVTPDGLKAYSLGLTSQRTSVTDISVLFTFRISVGWKPSHTVFADKQTADTLVLIDAVSRKTLKLTLTACGRTFSSYAQLLELYGASYNGCQTVDTIGGAFFWELNPFDTVVAGVLLGSGQSKVKADTAHTAARAFVQEREKYNAIRITTASPDLDVLFNRVLMPQILSSRLLGRTGFYQCSGAFGFRDQLQDVLALLYSTPEKVREHILTCAAHQYQEGDVMHWWHSPRTGVRTTIADDRLFLPYAVTEYISVTGDLSILDERVNYLKSAGLNKGEKSRYEVPSIGKGGKLSEHLLRAILSVLSYGQHGLLLIKGGDWNDGLDKVGEEGIGESVWLTMFAKEVIEKVIPLVDSADKQVLAAHLEKLSKGINGAFAHDRYVMCYADDGVCLGRSDSAVCSLALLPQAFAAICGTGEQGLTSAALLTARRLVDYKNSVIKLLEPPFTPQHYYGYISAYPAGIRENGGQYTHGAAWYVKALFLNGQEDYAYELLTMLNPVAKCADKEGTERYKGEPYAVAGDVYSASGYEGRCGWSWYTGSAAWLYRIILCDMIGFEVKSGRLRFKPRLPKALPAICLKYRYKGTCYNVEIKKGKEDSLTVNGTAVGNGYIVLCPDKGEIKVEVIYKCVK